MPDESLRTFIAIELDESLRRALQSLQNRLKRQMPPGSVKWVAPEGVHLTLKFLGDTPAARVSEIVAAMRTACTGYGAFDLVVEGRGCFPNFRRPRVVWVAVRDRSQTIGSLQAAIEREVAPLGWPTEERAFTPHLTLGRVSKTADPPRHYCGWTGSRAIRRRGNRHAARQHRPSDPQRPAPHRRYLHVVQPRSR